MLILASASPRRHELLLAAGIDHVVTPAHVAELQGFAESAEDFVMRLAEEKATAVAATGEDVVLGADTAVCVDDEVFGKPVDDSGCRTYAPCAFGAHSSGAYRYLPSL